MSQSRSPAPLPPEATSTSDRHLWQIRWVRDLGWIGGGLLVLLIAYLARQIVAPALIGLGLAYAINPAIRYLQRRARLPRVVGTALILLVFALAVALLLWFFIPPAVNQVEELLGNMPKYARHGTEKVESWMRHVGIEPRAVVQQTGEAGGASSMGQKAAALPWAKIGSVLTGGLNLGASVVSGTFGFVAYLAVAGVVIAFSFFFFSWHFDAIVAWGDSFVPHHAEQRVHHIAHRMDKSVSAFIRGRLIQAACVAVVLSVGWWIAGVPYWLLLGVLGGLLNLIPYAAVVACPLAILLAWFDSMAGTPGFSALHVFLWPTVVYVVAQSLDGWVVEPLVQGKATALDPLSVMLAVLIGAALMGLLGMLLAIPLAACGKILAQELVLPALRPAPPPRHPPPAKPR